MRENQQVKMKGVPDEKVTPESFVDETHEEPVVSEGQISIFESASKDAMIDEQIARDRLEEAIEAEKPKKKRKSIITNLIFLAINIAIMFFIIRTGLKEANGMPFSQIIQTQGKRLWWLAGGLVLFVIVAFADSMIFVKLIKNATGKHRPWLAYKVSSVGRYIDNITPFAVGGQPSQILNLTRAGLSPGVATSIPIIKLIIHNTVYAIILILVFIFGIPFLPPATYLNELLMILLKIFAVIGIFFTVLFNMIYILIGSGKIVGRSFVRFIVRLGYGLRIVKDYRKSYNKIMKTVLEYQSSIAYLKKNKRTMIACIFYSIIDVLALFAIPFMIVMAFSSIELTSAGAFFSLMWICMTKFVIAQMAAVVIPLPGGTGMMEFSFIAMFGVASLIGDAFIIWGLLAWRLFTYYLIILQGFVISTGSSIKRLILAKKNKNQVDDKRQENVEDSSEKA
ncbi:MAG: flippase-like domain-containing protein [Clostridia bacterium]|nr:flippase-like domain-containing protein [Clostridia bacterium]